MDGRLLTAYIRDWLDTLPREDRVLFVRRYWYGGQREHTGGGIPPVRGADGPEKC